MDNSFLVSSFCYRFRYNLGVHVFVFRGVFGCVCGNGSEEEGEGEAEAELRGVVVSWLKETCKLGFGGVMNV